MAGASLLPMQTRGLGLAVIGGALVVAQLVPHRIVKRGSARCVQGRRVDDWSFFGRGAVLILFAIVTSGHALRGGKLAAWVTDMCDETELVYASISTYVWGVRSWHVLQHQHDPVMGCHNWREFMRGIAVLSAVPGEPRRHSRLELSEL